MPTNVSLFPPWPARLSRHLPVVVPALTIGLAAVALATFAAPRVLVAVRVLGGATEAPGTHAIRLDCVRHAVGVLDQAPLDGIELTVGDRTQTVRCDASGSADVMVTLPGTPVRISVSRGGRVLAEGNVSVSRARARPHDVVRSARLLRTTFRGMKARAYLPGGVLVLGEAATIDVEVEPEDEAFAGLRCPGGANGERALSGPGVDVTSWGCGARGYEIQVRPSFVTASVSLVARAAPEAFVWEAQLPVTAAPVIEDLQRSGDRVLATLRTSVIVPSLHARIDDDDGRRLATRVPLVPDGRGGAWARLSLTLPADLAPDAHPVLVVGTDDGVSMSSRALLLPPADPRADVVLVAPVLWLDGLPPMLAADQERTRKARGWVGFLVVSGAILEALLVLRRSRESAHEFRAHLASASASGDGGEGSEGDQPFSPATLEDQSRLSGVLVALVAILFGFAVVGVLVFART